MKIYELIREKERLELHLTFSEAFPLDSLLIRTTAWLNGKKVAFSSILLPLNTSGLFTAVLIEWWLFIDPF